MSGLTDTGIHRNRLAARQLLASEVAHLRAEAQRLRGEASRLLHSALVLDREREIFERQLAEVESLVPEAL